jgi:hypothetical protein
MATALNS